jgi:hypothetical protein
MNLSDLHKDISLEIESLDRIITAVERLSERTISGEFTDDDLFIAAAIILNLYSDTISMTALRKFRHIVIHGYNFTLNPSRVQTAMQEIPALYQRFRTEVLEFLRSLS